MAVTATHVLATGGSSPVQPYKIAVTPSAPAVGETVSVSILSAASDWSVWSPYGGLHGKKREPVAQSYRELLSVAGGTVATTAPVARFDGAIASSPILRDKVYLFPPGDVGLRKVLKRVFASIVADYDDLIGSGWISYTTFRAQTWRLDGRQNPGEFVLYASAPSLGIVDEPVPFTVSEGDSSDVSQPSIVTVQTKSFCTDLPVDGAAVYVGNKFIGSSDINGKVFVGLLPSGSYGIKCQATGYLPTDGDDLNNDSFTI